jgi:uncharacterized protein
VSDAELTVRIAPSVGSFGPEEWNALGGNDNPFVSHEFLTAMEDSGSVGPGTGWEPAPIAITDDAGRLLAAMPSYAKGHSQGEYVFDHSWADAWHRAGGRYYPKLQIAAPFTPATGPRLLLSDPSLAPHLLKGAEAVCLQNRMSSAHATFIERPTIAAVRSRWLDAAIGYPVPLVQPRLQQLRGFPRCAVIAQAQGPEQGARRRDRGPDDPPPDRQRDPPGALGCVLGVLSGYRRAQVGHPYLTREAFSLLGERMGDRIVLILAYDGDTPIAGALNFVGRDALYGRYWGCTREVRFLHFELCYYQAIDIAIARGLVAGRGGRAGRAQAGPRV